jgi:hypothetical protein
MITLLPGSSDLSAAYLVWVCVDIMLAIEARDTRIAAAH